MENTVETLNNLESVQDDAVQAQGESLAAIVNETPAQSEAPVQTETAGTSEPGWMKQRIDKAVSKALRESEARIRAEYDAKYAPLQQAYYDQQARDLVESGEFKSIERAREYVALKNGVQMPQQAEAPAAPARDASGRFAKAEPAGEDPVLQAKAQFLGQQAQKIQERMGLDVMGYMNQNEEIKQKVLGGEMDFYDVAEMMGNRRMPPSPVRTSNGAGANRKTVGEMTDEEFERLNQSLASGRRFDMRI